MENTCIVARKGVARARRSMRNSNEIEIEIRQTAKQERKKKSEAVALSKLFTDKWSNLSSQQRRSAEALGYVSDRVFIEHMCKSLLEQIKAPAIHFDFNHQDIDEIELSAVSEALLRRRAPIKSVLLDQKFMAGVGNWIADEACYQAKLNPHRLGVELEQKEAKNLVKKTVSVIQKACSVDAEKNRFPRTWLFHNRWGKVEGARTAKGELIQFDTIGGRTTAWVPVRQS